MHCGAVSHVLEFVEDEKRDGGNFPKVKKRTERESEKTNKGRKKQTSLIVKTER